MTTTFEENLAKYAQVMTKIGMNIQPNEWVKIQAPINSAPFVRQMVKNLYEQGVAFVDVRWVDRAVIRERLLHAAPETLSIVPKAQVAAEEEHNEHRSTVLSITGDDPDWMAGVAAERVGIWRKALGEAMEDVQRQAGILNWRWLVAAYPTEKWAQTVFPDKSADEAVSALWDAIFKLSRVYEPDPIAAWQTHIDDLQARSKYLNDKRYKSLHYLADGTDLLVGLADNHKWEGAGSLDGEGRWFVPNIPTEEVFTAPHKDHVTGVVKVTKPYLYMGTRIEGATFKFEEGRVVSHDASVGLDALTSMLDTDEGARRLGEVALVPHSSPVGQTGILFYNTLFDENASCHMAFGRAYEISILNSEGKSLDELQEYGLNKSYVHEDMMIGDADMDIDGILDDGRVEPLLRGGEWAF